MRLTDQRLQDSNQKLACTTEDVTAGGALQFNDQFPCSLCSLHHLRTDHHPTDSKSSSGQTVSSSAQGQAAEREKVDDEDILDKGEPLELTVESEKKKGKSSTLFC